MKRLFKVVLLLFVIVVVAIVVLLNFFGGAVIEKTVNLAGPQILGVPVTLEDASLALLRGHVRLKGLRVGNPEGFHTDSLFDLGLLEIDLDVKSLGTDTIHIRKILIEAPGITYERGLTTSNIGKLLEHLESPEAPDEGKKPEEKPAPAEEGSTKVIIDQFVLSDARLKVSITGAAGLAAPIPLPTLELNDIGKEEEGASFASVIRDIVKAIAGSITSVLTGAGKLVGEGAVAVGKGAVAVGGAAVDGAAAVGGAAVDGAAAVGDAAMDGAAAVGKGAAAVGGAAVDGAAAVGGAAVDGAAAVGKGAAKVGGAVLGGAGKLVGGIGHLVTGGEEKQEKKDEKEGVTGEP
jgi:hypothetical protein